jgi:hypothetical protein
MLGSEVLDAAIGVIFVFLLVSMISSAIREGLEALLKTRATHLEEGIRILLHDTAGTGLAKHFFEHPLIYGLYDGEYAKPVPRGIWPAALTRGKNMPSYIPSRNFALALMDMAARGPIVDDVSSQPDAGTISFAAVRANISSIGSPPIQRVLLSAIDTAQGDLQQAQANIEDWYDSSMDRVSGWYKRSTQWILFGIGLFMAIGFNVNTLTVAEYLYREKAARETLIARAQAAVADQNYPSREYGQIKAELGSLNLPIGWSVGVPRARSANGSPIAGDIEWLEVIFGWLVTAFAAALGAPFWFDVLNKVMVIRSTVKPHEKSPEESSEDRQAGNQPASAPTGSSAPHGAAPPPAPAPVSPTATASGTMPTPPVAPDRIDGCDVDIVDATPDEELPAAEGGVA